MLVRIALGFAIAVVSSAPARAQPKTDVVALANGDRITGEIVDLDRGRLEFKTDDAGTIYFEWDNIVRVESTRQFEVITSDGRRFLGSLGPSSGRTIQIAGTDSVITLSIPEVTSILVIGARFWAKLDGSVNAGFTYTRSSEIAQTTLNSDTVFRQPAFTFRLTVSATLTQRNEEEESEDDRAALEFSYVNYRGRRWFVSGAARFESNESLGLALRSQGGGLIGIRPVNTNRAQFEFGGGAVVNNETGVDHESTQNLEGLLGLKTSYYSYDTPKTTIDASFQYYPSLSNWGRQRLQLDAAVNRDIWKDFFVAVNLYDTFDSDPPDPDAARNDVGIVVSVGWSY